MEVDRAVLSERDKRGDTGQDGPAGHVAASHDRDGDRCQEQRRQAHIQVRLPVSPQAPLQVARSTEDERQDELRQAERGERVCGRLRVRDARAETRLQITQHLVRADERSHHLEQ